jgi:hypothetical protein
VGALRRPIGLQPCVNRHFRNLRLRFNYRSQMSQLTVTHPSLYYLAIGVRNWG